MEFNTPTPAELSTLPPRARVALAVRWSRYVAPIASEFVSSRHKALPFGIFGDAIQYADTFASLASGEEGSELDDTFSEMAIARCAKFAEDCNEEAHVIQDDKEMFLSDAAYCAIWAIGFAARAVNNPQIGESHVELLLESIVYAVKALGANEMAKLSAAGTTHEQAVEEVGRMYSNFSNALNSDIQSLSSHLGPGYPSSLFGPPLFTS